MGEADPIVFVVDDDTAIRQALDSLIRSIGLRVRSFATAQAGSGCACVPGAGCALAGVERS
jgi:FixJ family two-component response regulator